MLQNSASPRPERPVFHLVWTMVVLTLCFSRTTVLGKPDSTPKSAGLAETALTTADGYTRLAFRFTGPLQNYHVSRSELNEIRLIFETAPDLTNGLPDMEDSLVSGVSAGEKNGDLQVSIRLKTTHFSFRHFHSADSRTIIIDLKDSGPAGGAQSDEAARLKDKYRGIRLETPDLETVIRDIQATLPSSPARHSDEALLAKALNALSAARYNRAMDLLRRLAADFPQSEYRAPAAFLLADAGYYQHEERIYENFLKITNAYQEALTCFPDSALAPRGSMMIGLVYLKMKYPSEAAGYFSILIKDYPDTFYAHLARFFLSQAYLDLNRPDQAREAIEFILSLDPADQSGLLIYFRLGQVYFLQALYTKANEIFIEILNRDPEFHLKTPEILYYLGEGYYHSNLMSQARSYLFHLVNLQPEFEDRDMALARIGDAYGADGLTREAKKTYRLVKDLCPRSTGALISRIRLSEYGDLTDISDPESFFTELEGETSKAVIKVYEEIIAAKKDSPLIQLAMFKVGLTAYQQNNLEAALKILRDSLFRYPGGPVAEDVRLVIGRIILEQITNLYERKNYLDLISFYSQYGHFASEGSLADVRLYAGLAHLELHLAREAMELFLADINETENARARLAGLGRAYFELNNHEMAVKTFMECLARFPDDPDNFRIFLTLAQAADARGSQEESLSWYESAAKANPELRADGEYSGAIGRLYLARGKYDQAALALNTAAAAMSAQPDKKDQVFLVHARLGRALARANRFEEAASTLETALKSQPAKAVPEALYLIAQTYFDLNRPEQATSTLNLVLQTGDAFWNSMAARELEARRLNLELRKAVEQKERPPGEKDES